MSFEASKRTYLNRIAWLLTVAIIISLFCGQSISQERRSDEAQKHSFIFKELFYDIPGMTSITKIIQWKFDQDSEIKIGIFDQYSFRVVNWSSGATEKVIRFNWATGILRPDLIHSKTMKNQSCCFVAKGPVSDIGLMDYTGEPIWAYKSTTGEIVNTMAAGDLDQDGILEFYVATSRGLVKLDQSGIKLWEKSGWVDDVDIFNTGIANESLVVTISSNQKIQYRNSIGELVKEVVSPVQAVKIQNVEWPTPGHLLITAGNNIYILNFEGKIVFSYKLGQPIYAIRGTPVQFICSGKKYFAVVAKFSSTTGKAVLCIFTPSGELIYEALVRTTQGLLAMQAETSAGQILLVGNGPGKVYKYWITDECPSQKIHLD